MSVRPTAVDLARQALTPKWLGLAVVLIAAVVLCALAGRWQFTRTMDVLAAEHAAQQAPVPVQALTTAGAELPNTSVGRPVTASGRYLGDEQVIVLHRSFDGRPGVWVLTPLELDDGTVVAVLRGWIADPTAAGAVPPSGRVDVTGVVHPDERFYADAAPEPGTAVAISSAREAMRWAQPTRPGFIMLATQQPTSPDDPAAVPPTVSTTGVPFPLRNFVYSLQWAIFAIFAAGVFVRWLWLDAQQAREQHELGSGASDGGVSTPAATGA